MPKYSQNSASVSRRGGGARRRDEGTFWKKFPQTPSKTFLTERFWLRHLVYIKRYCFFYKEESGRTPAAAPTHFLFGVDNDIFLFKEIKPDIELKNMFVFYCRAGVYLPPLFVPITFVFGGSKPPPYKHFLYLIQMPQHAMFAQTR